MSYEQFAYLYDELMQDAPYDEWVRFVKEKLQNIKWMGKACLICLWDRGALRSFC